MRKLLPIILLIAVVVAAVAYFGQSKPARKAPPRKDALVASFLDAERGCATVVKTPEGRFVVIDPGPKDTADALIAHLRESGAQSLTILVTHPALEHIGAVESLMATFPVKRIMHGEMAGLSHTWEEQLEAAREAHVPELILSAGDTVHLSPKVTLKVLSPPSGLIENEGPRSPSNSLVTQLCYGQTTLLLTSHIRTEAEGYLIQSGAALKSDVMVVPRHGQTGSSSLELISLVRPKCFVVMAGTGPDRPSLRVIERMSARHTGAEVYRTDHNGPVDVISNGREVAAITGVTRR